MMHFGQRSQDGSAAVCVNLGQKHLRVAVTYSSVKNADLGAMTTKVSETFQHLFLNGQLKYNVFKK